MISWILYAGAAWVAWTLLGGKEAPKVASAAPEIKAHPEAKAPKDHACEGFECLLKLQEVMRAHKVPEAQIRAILDPIAPMMMSAREE
jgi:hypothetical protein